MKIQGFSNYEIYPNEGKIFSYKSNRFVGNKNKNGYWKCVLRADDGTQWNTSIHRVIWTAVNGAIPQGYEINHRDENPSNNILSNLELVTHKENINYGTCIERAAKAKKGIIPKSNPPKQVAAYKDGQLIMIFPSTNEAGRNGYNQGAVGACCRNCFNRQGNNLYKGYSWRYL